MDKTVKNINTEQKCKIILEAISDYFGFKLIYFGSTCRVYGFADKQYERLVYGPEQTTMTDLSYSRLLGKVVSSKEFLTRTSEDQYADIEVHNNPFFGIVCPSTLCLKLNLLGYDMSKISES